MSTPPRNWPVPLALVALSAIPLAAGTLRLIQMAGGPAVIPADHRFAGFPLPLIVHIVGATTYALVAIPQFVPRLRHRHPDWHRRAGRVATAAGLLVAISALWMTLFYEAKPGTGDLLYIVRLGFGSAMDQGAASLKRSSCICQNLFWSAAHSAAMAAAGACG